VASRLFVKTNSAAMLPLFGRKPRGSGLGAGRNAGAADPAPLFCGRRGSGPLLGNRVARSEVLGDGQTVGPLGAALARFAPDEAARCKGPVPSAGNTRSNYIGLPACRYKRLVAVNWGGFSPQTPAPPQFEAAAASGGPLARNGLQRDREPAQANGPAWLNGQ